MPITKRMHTFGIARGCHPLVPIGRLPGPGPPLVESGGPGSPNLCTFLLWCQSPDDLLKKSVSKSGLELIQHFIIASTMKTRPTRSVILVENFEKPAAGPTSCPSILLSGVKHKTHCDVVLITTYIQTDILLNGSKRRYFKSFYAR